MNNINKKNKSDAFCICVFSSHKGVRLDKFLPSVLTDMSRSRLQALIKDGHVFVNMVRCATPSKKVENRDEIRVEIPPLKSADPVAQNIPLDIVFEDDDLIVLNKPVGLVVHPGAGCPDGTLVNALLHYCGDRLSGIGGVMRPGIVHRLDKETSGLMVVAKSDIAHKGLSEQLQDRSLSRKYKALVLGLPIPAKGAVDKSIGRHKGNRLKMAVYGREGSGIRSAKTFYKVLESYNDEFSLLECQLESGRTHQIRVHMEYIRHFIVGDRLYGAQPTAVQAALRRGDFPDKACAAVKALSHQALHAYVLEFIHPVSGDHHRFEQEPPEYFTNVINLLRG